MSEKRHNMLTGGIVLITLGVLIYFHKSGDYTFDKTWPVLLIAVGICTLIQQIRDFGGWFITLAGVGFLFYQKYGFDVSQYSNYLLPGVIILLGIFFILRRKK
ncbi:MAG: hypothetical protein JW976_11615 [Syntrophaceae bacterium]|nr:hypothetical protein [Syntrophaceae bacterium]